MVVRAAVTRYLIGTMQPLRRRPWAGVLRYAALALTLLALLAACDTGSQAPALSEQEAEDAPLEDPFLRFTFGSISLLRNGQETPVEPGDPFRSGDRVQLSEDSVVELQYADAALIRVDGPAEFELRRRRRDDGTRVVTFELFGGSAIVRRNEESVGRTVRMLTDSGVVEAEATSYMVSREESGETIVSVAQGRVQVLPAGVDPEELLGLTDIDEILSAIDEIADSSVFVDADGEVVVRPEDVAIAGVVLRDMKVQLSQYGAAEAPSDEEIQSITALLRYARERIGAVNPETRSATPERVSRIDQLRERKLLNIDTATPGERPDAGLSRLRVETDPPDAQIFVDDLPVGSRLFSSLFEPGERVRLSIRRRGYQTEEIDITFEPDLNENLFVELSRIEPEVEVDELRNALRAGDHAVVARYLETGGDPNVSVDGDYSALAVAFGAGLPLDQIVSTVEPDFESVELLLGAGANPDTVFGSVNATGSRLTPLSSIILSGLYRNNVHYDLVELLLGAGASPDILMETGEMRVTALALPIIVGIENGAVEAELVELLLEAGSDPSITVVYEGRLLSPLATALALGSDHDYDPVEVVILLIEAGAAVERAVRIGGMIWSPLEFAEEAGLDRSAEALRVAEASLDS